MVAAKLAEQSSHLSCQLFSATQGTGLVELEQKLNHWFSVENASDE